VLIVLNLGGCAVVMFYLHDAFHFNHDLVQNWDFVLADNDAIEFGLAQLDIPWVLNDVFNFVARLGIS